MRFHKPSNSVSHTVNGIFWRVTVLDGEEGPWQACSAANTLFLGAFFCVVLHQGQLWLQIWEQHNKNCFFFFNLQHWETRSCKADDFTEFERSVVLQNDYINATLSFTVWSLYARACCKCCSINLSASPLVSCDVGKQQTRERSVGVPWGQVNLSGWLKPTTSVCNMG